jgi:tetratricopeptide (TPR) repeat protein
MGVSRRTVFALYAQAYEGLGRRAEAIAAWRATLRQPDADAWQYWGRLARVLSAYGDAPAALAAADSAMTRIHPADSASARVVRELIDTVRRDCYGDPHAMTSRAGCTDPMGVWAVLVPLPGRNARNSQNASSAADTTRAAVPGEAL